MQAAIEQFRSNIQRTRSIGEIYLTIGRQTTDPLDISDLLRAEWVMAVSSLDHYIHELVRLGMLEAYREERIRTQSFLRFQVALGGVLEIINGQGDDTWLENQIRTRHSHLSFQNPDNIAEAIRLISNVQLWNTVARQLTSTPQAVRTQLREIVNRRNYIAHEADIIPWSYTGSLWPIDFALADQAVTFIEEVAEAIYAVVA